MDLKYAKENKNKSAGGWVLDFDYIMSIASQMEELDEDLIKDLETIEAVLLIANGEKYLLKQ